MPIERALVVPVLSFWALDMQALMVTAQNEKSRRPVDVGEKLP
jgi:hypothetical protein